MDDNTALPLDNYEEKGLKSYVNPTAKMANVLYGDIDESLKRCDGLGDNLHDRFKRVKLVEANCMVAPNICLDFIGDERTSPSDAKYMSVLTEVRDMYLKAFNMNDNEAFPHGNYEGEEFKNHFDYMKLFIGTEHETGACKCNKNNEIPRFSETDDMRSLRELYFSIIKKAFNMDDNKALPLHKRIKEIKSYVNRMAKLLYAPYGDGEELYKRLWGPGVDGPDLFKRARLAEADSLKALNNYLDSIADGRTSPNNAKPMSINTEEVLDMYRKAFNISDFPHGNYEGEGFENYFDPMSFKLFTGTDYVVDENGRLIEVNKLGNV